MKLCGATETAPACTKTTVTNTAGTYVVDPVTGVISFTPEASFTVTPETLFHRHPITPYRGLTLHGVVHATYLHGRRVYTSAHGHVAPQGQLLFRETILA